MRNSALAITFATTLALTGAAFAQTTGTTSGNQAATTPTQPGGSRSGSGPHTSAITIGQLKQELQQAGFSDIEVLEDAFVVRAKTKEGHPIILTIGPGGFSAVENLSTPGSTQQRSGQTGTGSTAHSPSTGSPGMTSPSTSSPSTSSPSTVQPGTKQ